MTYSRSSPDNAHILEIAVHGKTYRLIQTSIAAPEQYDVFLNGLEVGYIRLRHGKLRADYTAGATETVYAYADPQGSDDFFEDARERYLTQAVSAIHLKHHVNKSE